LRRALAGLDFLELLDGYEKAIIIDAVQTTGHIPVNVNDLNLDLLSLSAHKFYGPKGAGALYIRKGTRIERFFHGGDQENGRRASTHNRPVS
jgi:cysteine desulfurase